MRHKLIVGMLLMLTSATTAHACTCAGGVIPSSKFDPTNGLDGWAAVFVGRVASVEEIASNHMMLGREVTFEVEKYWKGAGAGRVIVSTGHGDGDCGFPFARGTKYFVMADEFRGLLYTNICYPTTKSRKASRTINQFKLGRGKLPAKS